MKIKKLINKKLLTTLVILYFLNLIYFVYAIPLIDFVNPSPPNNLITSNTSVEINISITELSLGEFKWNWNSTNYTLYNDSLVLMFNFDNVSLLGENNTYFVDSSKYSNNGTGKNFDGNEIVTGKYGRAFNSEGVNDYIRVGDVDLYPALSVELWFYANENSWKDDWQGIIAKRADGTEALRTNFGLNIRGGTTDAFQWYWRDTSASAYLINSISASGITTQQWHYFVGILEQNGSNLESRFFIDGVLKNFTTYSSKNLSNGLSNFPILIGISRTDLPESFNGTIDEIRIWNMSLNSEQVEEHYMSNLYKYDTDKWVLYVNQTKNSTTNLSDGTYTHQAFAQNSSGSLNSTEVRTLIIDTTFPTLSNYTETPTNGSIYLLGATYEFNVTLTEKNTNTIGIEFNGINYTLTKTNLSATTYNFTISNLAAGTHEYYWWVNDSVRNYNTSEIKYYTINKSVGDVELYLNGLTQNKTLELGDSVTINASVLSGDGTFIVYLDGVIISEGRATTNTTTPSSIGSKNVSVIMVSTQNYTADTQTRWIDVRRTSVSESGGGGGGGVRRECIKDKDCIEGYSCLEYKCLKLFDIKILEFDSPVQPEEFFNFSYLIKGTANMEGDVVISFWLENEGGGEIITSGSDVIYLKNFEEKIESTKIFLPSDTLKGIYKFYVQVDYQGHKTTSSQTIEVNYKDNENVLDLDINLLELPSIKFGEPLEFSFILIPHTNSLPSLRLKETIKKTEDMKIVWQEEKELNITQEIIINEKINGLEVGDYQLEVRGYYKGREASMIQNFSVKKRINFIMPIIILLILLIVFVITKEIIKILKISKVTEESLKEYKKGEISPIGEYKIKKANKISGDENDIKDIKNIIEISGKIGLKVYSSDGKKIGKIEDIYLLGNRIYGWLIKIRWGIRRKLKIKKILVKYKDAKGIRDVLIIDKRILEYLEQLKK